MNGDSLLQHIIEGLSGEKLNAEIGSNAKAETDALTKDQVIAKLTESFAAVKKAMEDATAGSLAREVQFFGRTTTARGIYTVIDMHIAEHMGQLIAYCRMNGIVPPWSK